MKTLIEQIKAPGSYDHFNSLPGRIFLDTNVLQYLQDLGECIFEHYQGAKMIWLTQWPPDLCCGSGENEDA